MAANKKKKSRFSNDIRLENRRARFDYEILEKFEAGIELTGCEVKSIRAGQASLSETFAHPSRGQIWLKGMHIKPYEEGNLMNADPYRERRLLLHRKEIDRLTGAASQQGLTLVPLRLYFNARGWAKVELALARGKKEHDKRDSIRERDVQRDIRREYKTR
jgi:SsrA-binding protein